jgi:hypothetical protein
MQKIRELLGSTRGRLIAGGVSLLLIGGVIGGLITAIPALAAGQSQHQAGATNYCQIYAQTLEKNLNISQQQLESANQAAIKAAVQQMVTDGKLTQSQANQIEQNATNNAAKICARIGNGAHGFGRGPHGPGMGGKFGGALQQARQAIVSAVAAKLGISATTLTSAIQGGQNIVSLASQHGVSQSQLNSTILAAVQTQLASAVKAGTITSAQSTQLQTMVTNEINAGHYQIVGLGTRPAGKFNGQPTPTNQ